MFDLPSTCELREVKGRGRCLVASRDIPAGTAVLLSLPFAHTIQSTQEDRCHHCLISRYELNGKALSACARCKKAVYCSRACQSKDWKRLHKKLCSTVLPDHCPDEARLACAVLIARDLAPLPSADASVRAPTWEQFCSLESSEAGVAHEDDIVAFVKAVGIQADRHDVERVVRSHSRNHFAIWNDIIATCGAGVYPYGALLNHSCEPNCVIMYQPRTHVQIVRAIENIKQGEELCHSYLDQCMPTEQRQLQFMQQYGFSCTCGLCAGVEGRSLRDQCLLGIRSDVGTVLASDKDLTVPLQYGEISLTKTDDFIAPAQMRDLDEAVREQCAKWIQMADDMLEKAQDVRLEAATGAVLAEKAFAVFHRLCHPLSMRLLSASTWFQNLSLENGSQSPELRRVAEKIGYMYEHLYPPTHPLVGLQWAKVGDICSQQGKEAHAQVFHSKALGLLRISHGADSALVKMLSQAYNM